jgi:hypothetical protein
MAPWASARSPETTARATLLALICVAGKSHARDA